MANKFEPDVLYLSKYLTRILDYDLNEKLDKFDLTSAQGRILFFVKHNADEGIKICQSDIIKRFDLSKSTMSGLIKRLSAKDFIRIESCKNQTFIYPSEKTNDLVKYFEDNREKVKELMLKDISKENQELLKELLEKMINNMKEGSNICGKK